MEIQVFKQVAKVSNGEVSIESGEKEYVKTDQKISNDQVGNLVRIVDDISAYNKRILEEYGKKQDGSYSIQLKYLI